MLRSSKTARLPVVELSLNMDRAKGKDLVDPSRLQSMILMVGIDG